MRTSCVLLLVSKSKNVKMPRIIWESTPVESRTADKARNDADKTLIQNKAL